MLSLKSPLHVANGKLDEILGGGVKQGSFMFIIGPPLCGKEALAREFFYKGLENQEGSMYLVTNQFAEDVVTEMAESGQFLSMYQDGDTADYRVIDCLYNTVAPAQVGEAPMQPGFMYVSSAADLMDISSKINQGLVELRQKFQSVRLVFDSMSSLLSVAMQKAVLRFATFLKGKLRLAGGLTLVLLDTEAGDVQSVRTIMQLADLILEIEEGGKLRVKQRNQQEQVFPFSFDNNTITIG